MNREEIEAASGVTGRNIRFLTAEGILPPPVGPARSAQYTDEHLRILKIYTEAKSQGVTSLDVIRRRIAEADARSTTTVMPGIELTIDRSAVPEGVKVEEIMAALKKAVEEKLSLEDWK